MTGAVFCLRERHIKRMLAFSTISHVGMFGVGIALLTPLGLAGTAVYVIGHGLVKGALFLCTGVVLHRLSSVNEPYLHGRGRELRITGAVFTLAGLALAGLAPFAGFAGHGWIGASAETHGLAWITVVMVVCTVLAGGTVLRVAGGVFYGLGDPPGEDPEMAQEAAEETSETDEAKQRTPLTMVIPPAGLLAVALGTGVLGVIGKLGPAVQAMAVRFEDQGAYNAAVLAGVHTAHPVGVYPPEPAGVTLTDLLVSFASVGGALVLAWVALYWRRLPALRGYRPSVRLATAARRFQSGVVNDYVTWIVLGLACLGGVLALVVR